jgi:hypothetical protein
MHDLPICHSFILCSLRMSHSICCRVCVLLFFFGSEFLGDNFFSRLEIPSLVSVINNEITIHFLQMEKKTSLSHLHLHHRRSIVVFMVKRLHMLLIDLPDIVDLKQGPMFMMQGEDGGGGKKRSEKHE